MTMKLICTFECNKTWQDLSEIPGKNKVRYCSHCEKCVYWCDDEKDLNKHVVANHCIIVPQALANSCGLSSKARFIVGNVSIASYDPQRTGTVGKGFGFED